jgi:uncharacterized repeat protein (TIGR01451 family)
MKFPADLIARLWNHTHGHLFIAKPSQSAIKSESVTRQSHSLIAIVSMMLSMLCPSLALAQAAPCTPNEDSVTFFFATAASQGSVGASGVWPAGSMSNTFPVASTAYPNYNTIAFTITASASAPLVSPDPSQQLLGADNNSLDMNMNATGPGQGITLTMVFNRPMDKISFTMHDLDRYPTVTTSTSTVVGWQDVVRVAGYLNSAPMPAPVLVPQLPSNHAITSVAEFTQITPVVSGNCGSNTNLCNFKVNFSDPVDRVVVVFESGSLIADPAEQRIGFNNILYCVPKRDLRLLKAGPATPFIAGKTATYSLTASNLGNVATTGSVDITDVIATQGVSFVTPQTPAGWSCTFTNTAAANDTANCSRSTAISGKGGAATLSLMVSVSPDATATAVVNQAKVYGGGDPNKPNLTATGPVTNCRADNENQSGGGAFIFGGLETTNAGCAYESTALVRQALLTVDKTNNVSTLEAGGTTSYVLTFSNAGPSDAPGSVVNDPIVPGLDCNTLSFTSSPPGMVSTSPFPPTVQAMQGPGIMLTSFPANSTVNFTLTCGVTATGG